MRELRIVHLYPDLLRTYGDRGNITVLTRRASLRGIAASVVAVSRGDHMPDRADLIFIGGGSDRVQTAVGSDLLARRERICDLVSDGCVVLGVCGGYQLLGSSYLARSGPVEGIGLLDVRTVAGAGRIVGLTRATHPPFSPPLPLIGFENHAGRSWLGPGATPLGRVARGSGNNGIDRTDGAVNGRVFGTYLHGPVLALNPAFADHLLSLIIGSDLAPLPDDVERTARREWPGARWKRLSLTALRRG